jgi:hypothetical protein
MGIQHRRKQRERPFMENVLRSCRRTRVSTLMVQQIGQQDKTLQAISVAVPYYTIPRICPQTLQYPSSAPRTINSMGHLRLRQERLHSLTRSLNQENTGHHRAGRLSEPVSSQGAQSLLGSSYRPEETGSCQSERPPPRPSSRSVAACF